MAKKRQRNSQNYSERIGDAVTIYTRGQKQIYWIRFRYERKDENFSLETRSLTVARRKATKIAAEVIDETYKSKPAYKLCIEAKEDFLNYHKVEGRARKTIVRYEGEIRGFCEFAKTQGVNYLHQIDVVLFDRYRAQMSLSHAETTLDHESRTIKQWLKWCRKRKMIRENPLADYDLKKPKKKRTPKLTMDQINLILSAAEEPRRTQIAFLAFTGARVGEMQHMLDADVDLASNWIHIVSREGARTKSGEDRKLPIHPRLRQVLEALPPRKTKWLFTVAPCRRLPKGDGWLNPKTVNDDFRALLTAVGIPSGRKEGGFTTHSLRGFFKSHCINSGIPKPVVDEWQGHSNLSDASELYYGLPDDVSQEWMTKVPFPETVEENGDKPQEEGESE